MSKVTMTKTNFTAGELSLDMLGRGDMSAYQNGAKTLVNVFISPTGGVSRRSGLRYVAPARGRGRLIAFEFNTEQTYLMVLTPGNLDIFDGAGWYHMDEMPWTTPEQIVNINWTQSADTLLLVHPELMPMKITRTATGWKLRPWSFYQHGGKIYVPFHKFADADVTLKPSAVSGEITITASADVFVAAHQNLHLRIQGKEVKIIEVLSAKEVKAETVRILVDTEETKDWEEQAFSPVHGWPASVCFHQDRLVIGGSRDLPNRLWMSKSSDLFNFDLGEGLDDEAIEFTLLSDQVNAIRAVFSGRHLQVFTSGAEWMVSGEPLTPTKIQLTRQTRVGSPVTYVIPPRDVDGATLFVSRNGKDLREFLFADVEQAYQATDLAMLAKHVMNGPKDQDYDASRRLFHVVMNDGSMSTLTIYRAEKVTAWCRHETAGRFHSVAVVDDDVYVLVQRGSHWFIEMFDEGLHLDCALSGESETPRQTWNGFGHLEGRTITVVADGGAISSHAVVGGSITLEEPASAIQAGLPFQMVIEPLPPVTQGSGGPGTIARLVKACFRLLDTQALAIDTGRGLTSIPFRRFGRDRFDATPPAFSGDVTIRAIGWKRDAFTPLWRIAQDVPLPCTVLAVSTEMKLTE